MRYIWRHRDEVQM